ncbi:M23 family metallopeptidase [Alicyclobacillus sp. SO9]|uniref:M23 family metallopeptidase n=1 Tax=Alicyclobacillus sp. SO9 TaxID=2665646 RepID=UPI0018E8197B|nr:M23 family metallopeptidase [Alicyclobacillus sp. SO9]QQE79463.1 peptidoglycan DD-metalloendopeptidase family protein [Alicyclobacillus sp. SO9]
MRWFRRGNRQWQGALGDPSLHQKLLRLINKINWQSMKKSVQEIDWTPYKQPRFIVAGSTAATFLVLSGGFVSSHINHTKAWNEVFTNGTYVGLVPSNNATISGMKRTAAGYNINLQFVPVHKQVAGSYDWQRVTTLPEKAYAVALNGSPLVYTNSPSAAQKVIRQVKQALVPKHLSATAQVQFSGAVSVQQSIVGVAQILSTQAAALYLLNPGQNFSTSSRSVNILSAARAHGGPNIQVSNFSPSASVHEFPASAKVSVTTDTFAQSRSKAAKQSTSQPLLTVDASEVVQKQVNVKYPVKRIKDARAAAGTVKVVAKGQSGVVSEKVRQVYKNGKLVSSKVLSKDVLKKPVTQVEDVGTNRGIAAGNWIWPVPSSHIITSGYGPRYLFGRWGFHPGIDIGCPVGTPIVATNDGVVEDAGWNSGGYGIWIKLNNGHGIETVYGHLSKVKVHPGETVAKGQVIGYSGATGFVTGPHLHYEIRKNGQHINPQPYM